jgi:hypothetical protein
MHAAGKRNERKQDKRRTKGWRDNISIVAPQTGCQAQITIRVEDISNQIWHPETITSQTPSQNKYHFQKYVYTPQDTY